MVNLDVDVFGAWRYVSAPTMSHCIRVFSNTMVACFRLLILDFIEFRKCKMITHALDMMNSAYIVEMTATDCFVDRSTC